MGSAGGCTMNFIRPSGSGERPETAASDNGIENEGRIGNFDQHDGGPSDAVVESDSGITAVNLDTFMRRMSADSVREVDSLIKQLQVLREKLVGDGNRVERRIVDYTAMGQSVSQLTKIVSDGVSRLKDTHD